jgi:hypothetical protein
MNKSSDLPTLPPLLSTPNPLGERKKRKKNLKSRGNNRIKGQPQIPFLPHQKEIKCVKRADRIVLHNDILNNFCPIPRPVLGETRRPQPHLTQSRRRKHGSQPAIPVPFPVFRPHSHPRENPRWQWWSSISLPRRRHIPITTTQRRLVLLVLRVVPRAMTPRLRGRVSRGRSAS